MPANLPPQFYEVEKKLREARTPAEKIGVIEELLTIIPKHKGTEHLRGDYKKRLAKLREEQIQKKAKVKSGADFWQIEREGAGQVPFVGLPNSGKSSLLKALTKANPEIAPYPFTTRLSLPGMMSFEDIQIQLIDLPPLSPDFMESWYPEILRQGDLWLIVLDLDDDPLAQLKQAKTILARFKLYLPEGPSDQCPHPSWIFRPVLLAGNKLDRSGALDTLEIYQALQPNGFPIIGL
ncbi:MAG: GTP-binding protein, partial [Desulfobacca sp.]|nr:GTP-binding protein [Desulfobacca sp.]